MFSNIINKIADRDYLLNSQCFFDFVSGGEQNCQIKILNYDLRGNIREEVDIGNLTNDLLFLLYGGYMFFWLAQILESGTGINRNDPAFWNMWGPKLNPMFTVYLERNSSGTIHESIKNYNLSDILSLFDQNTKVILTKKHSTVQFKIHKVYKNLLVRVINLPILSVNREIDGQLYLFVILFDFFCKQYINAHKILGTGCDVLMNHSLNRPFPVIAYRIMEVMIDNPERMSDISSSELHTKVWKRIIDD